MPTLPPTQLSIDTIVKELSRPEAYPYPVEEIEVIQTHISVVFLAGHQVYKVKKPVDFGFLDFTSLEKRKHFCEEEIRLNRRLSPDMYLGMTTVSQGPDGLRFGDNRQEGSNGESVVLEYAVVMKRLDKQLLLSQLLAHGKVDTGHMENIAKRIAEFHQQAETSAHITATGGIEAVRFNTEEDFQQIEPHIGRTLTPSTYERIADFTRTFIGVNAELFTSRDEEGWIRDGHGDLHTQHICLGETIQIFDCIEFNERFRFGDILVDAAFLSMDLEKLGFPELAEHYTKAYLGEFKQEKYRSLFNFYACYRAVVRGKVEGFRSVDSDIGVGERKAAKKSAREFHQLAEKYSRTIYPPTMVVACGLMGSGKSSLAKDLAELVDVEVLSSDRIRKELAGFDPMDKHHVPFGDGIYSSRHTENTYAALHERAQEILMVGKSVFLDASYMDPEMRKRAAQVARKQGARFLLVYMKGDDETLRSRLGVRAKRIDEISDGREEILDAQLNAFVPPDELSSDQLLILDASGRAGDAARKLYRRLLSFS